MDCSLPVSSIHGIFQARVLEWVAISFSRGIFPTQGWNPGLPHGRQTLYHLSHQGSPGIGKIGPSLSFRLSPTHLSLYSNYSLRSYCAPRFNLGCRGEPAAPVPTLPPPVVGGHANTCNIPHSRSVGWAPVSLSLSLCFRSRDNSLELASSLQGSLPTSGLQPSQGLTTKPGSQSAASAQPQGHEARWAGWPALATVQTLQMLFMELELKSIPQISLFHRASQTLLDFHTDREA